MRCIPGSSCRATETNMSTTANNLLTAESLGRDLAVGLASICHASNILIWARTPRLAPFGCASSCTKRPCGVSVYMKVHCIGIVITSPWSSGLLIRNSSSPMSTFASHSDFLITLEPNITSAAPVSQFLALRPGHKRSERVGLV